MPLATVIALPTASALLIAFGWRFPFCLNMAVGVVATIVYLIVIREGPFARHKVEGSVRKAVLNAEIWKVGLAWLFFQRSAQL